MSFKGKKILIVSRDITQKNDGGTLVSKRNERLLNMLGYETERFVIPIPKLTTRFINIMFRQSYGATRSLTKKFRVLLNKHYDYIFFDGSIYGGYVKQAIEKGHKVICFHHNVEVEYYRQKAKQTRKLTDRLMVPYIRYNEYLSVNYSHVLIALNRRDSELLEKTYGRNAQLLLPTSFPFNEEKLQNSNGALGCKPYILFVGTNFFANYEGLNRFITKVLPEIKYELWVVGNINTAFKDLKKCPDNIKFLGQVDSLEKYYQNALAVIAPIFSGSGLKTKTVEALSFGKLVVGYQEAFEGIPINDYPGACVQVSDDKEFVRQINKITPECRWNKISFQLFRERFSDESMLKRLEEMFENFQTMN